MGCLPPRTQANQFQPYYNQGPNDYDSQEEESQLSVPPYKPHYYAPSTSQHQPYHHSTASATSSRPNQLPPIRPSQAYSPPASESALFAVISEECLTHQQLSPTHIAQFQPRKRQISTSQPEAPVQKGIRLRPVSDLREPCLLSSN